MTERWLPVSRDPAYEVSDQGRVRRKDTGRVRTATQNSSRAGKRPGYYKITLTGDKNAYVHALVAEAFLGPRPTGHDIDHIDWDRANNRASNLRYLPVTQNRMRWVGPGPRDFALAKEADREVPEDHVPMTETEAEELAREREEAGW